ncbi:hypothetical protein H4J50_16155 [Colwellia sp. 6M3]|jgi:hypothetical protein|uniref:hypothetical protein n=1 Tax=Colwellia sp. 6M3 TaxID=2759849 RepID=UPI0015F58DDF|nr:hypothetical protein [Colwellia sp. 6M3]MBA6417544.1 hypothetical protein [Colwellia sp. 6M3]|tara:strand:- start:3589 stop:3918 length:330 start_codon:yes stop_codon:yes gene_type:complete
MKKILVSILVILFTTPVVADTSKELPISIKKFNSIMKKYDYVQSIISIVSAKTCIEVKNIETAFVIEYSTKSFNNAELKKDTINICKLRQDICDSLNNEKSTQDCNTIL